MFYVSYTDYNLRLSQIVIDLVHNPHNLCNEITVSLIQSDQGK